MALKPLLQALTTTVLLLIATPPATAHPRHAWPLAPPHPVLRAFHAPPTPFGAGHRGVDLGSTADAPILAGADATVAFAGTVGTRRLVSLAHENGLRTTYEPINPQVKRGQQVSRGDVLGTLTPGHTGCTQPCLHWGAHRTTPQGRTYLDPLSLLTTTRVRLLPPTPRSDAHTPVRITDHVAERVTGQPAEHAAKRSPPRRTRVR